MLENISNEMIQKVFFLQISQNIFIHQWYFVYSLNEKKKKESSFRLTKVQINLNKAFHKALTPLTRAEK